MRLTLIAALVAGQLSFSAAQAAEPIVQTVEQHRDDLGEIDKRGSGFVHRSANYVFPPALADMPARKTITYGPGDGAVYYTLRGGANNDPWVDLFVYPAQIGLIEEEANVSGSLTSKSEAREIPNPVGMPGAPKGARERWYEAVIQGTPVLTGYRIVRDGAWFIKVRLTIPTAGGKEALDRAWRGLGAVPWSVAAKSSISAPSAGSASAPTTTL
ncbi:MAG: hypothetical protein ABIU10_10380 [Sphingomicrobium sp.]